MNARVAVVTDSASSLPPALAAQHEVTVIPLLLTVGGTTYRDGELSLDQLLPRLDEGVSTSGPTPGEFLDVVKRRLDEYDDVLVLTIAHTMSSTFDAARAAAVQLGERVRVLDTATAAGAQGLVVLAAANAAAAGGSVDEVEAAAQRAIGSVRLVATVASLDRLVRSGRVPGIAGWAGGKLGVNPLFEFRAGKVRRLRPAFSRRAALDRILSAWRTSPRPGASLRLAALHAQALDEAEELIATVGAEVRPTSAFTGEFSPVMVAHTGPGLVGLAWWWE